MRILAAILLCFGVPPGAIAPSFDDVRAAEPSSGLQAGADGNAWSGANVKLDEHSRAALLERWNRLTPEVQQRMRARFERFQALSNEEREAIALRTRRIQARAEIFYGLFSVEERARLDRLPPERKREVLIALATDEEEEQALRLRASLPPEVAERMTETRPEQRRAMLDELRERQEERLGPAIQRFGLQLGMDPSHVDRLKRLPIEQRKKKFLELAKALSTEQIASRELPPGLTPARWERMKELEPEEFFAAVMRLRALHPEVGWLPEREEAEGEPRSAANDELRMTMARIRAAGKLSEQDLIDLASLAAEERHAERTRLRRERILQLLRDDDLVSNERLAELEAAGDERFFAFVHDLTTPMRPPAAAPPPLEELRARLAEREGSSTGRDE